MPRGQGCPEARGYPEARAPHWVTLATGLCIPGHVPAFRHGLSMEHGVAGRPLSRDAQWPASPAVPTSLHSPGGSLLPGGTSPAGSDPAGGRPETKPPAFFIGTQGGAALGLHLLVFGREREDLTRKCCSLLRALVSSARTSWGPESVVCCVCCPPSFLSLGNDSQCHCAPLCPR